MPLGVWWTSNVEAVDGRLLSTLEPDLVIVSNASLSGGGGGFIPRVGKIAVGGPEQVSPYKRVRAACSSVCAEILY